MEAGDGEVAVPVVEDAVATYQQSVEAAFDENDGEDLVPVLSSVLQQLVHRDDKMAHRTTFTIFHALKPPAISIHKYLQRIFQYANCSRSCFVVALIYIDRIIQRNASFMITSLNIHRLLITSVMVAAKFFDDIYYDNAYYAKVGGIPTAEMNSLELEFLFMINFTLNVTPEVYRQYEHELMMHFRVQAPAGDGVSAEDVPAPVIEAPSISTPMQTGDADA